MKWKLFLGAIVVSMSLCSQSYGAGLLERMLGLKGGCCKSDCCETSCCEADPGCCEADPGCCEEPACCEQDACCDPCNSCCKRRCGGFLRNLFKMRRCCGDSCCGDSCCGSHGGHGDAPAAAAGDAAPMPPAPMADPSASIQSRRHVSRT